MILALAAALAGAHADLPPAPLEVSATVRQWRACVTDGLNRRIDLIRAGGDFHALANLILAECRPQQEATFAARSRWVAGLELGPAQASVALRRNERDLRAMHNLIVMRARRSALASDQGWD